MADTLGFVHLRVHSAYSLLEGALPLAKILKLADADGQPAVAITDTGNLFSALEFSEKASEKGLQPIVGCELALDFGDEPADRRRPHGTAVAAISTTEASAAGVPCGRRRSAGSSPKSSANSQPTIGCRPFSDAFSENSSAENRLPVSVMATAG